MHISNSNNSQSKTKDIKIGAYKNNTQETMKYIKKTPKRGYLALLTRESFLKS